MVQPGVRQADLEAVAAEHGLTPDGLRVARVVTADGISTASEDELRRVAGSQLDGRLVWLFVTQVLRGKVVDHAGHIADLEAELQVQRRVRGVLDQPLVLGPPAV